MVRVIAATPKDTFSNKLKFTPIDEWLFIKIVSFIDKFGFKSFLNYIASFFDAFFWIGSFLDFYIPIFVECYSI